jgi:hypothetical protein
MLREQMINFLEATVIFLLLTNALSILAAVWAIYLAGRRTAAPSAIQSRLRRFLAAGIQGLNSPLPAALRTRSN